jgi:hypothetical protein
MPPLTPRCRHGVFLNSAQVQIFKFCSWDLFYGTSCGTTVVALLQRHKGPLICTRKLPPTHAHSSFLVRFIICLMNPPIIRYAFHEGTPQRSLQMSFRLFDLARNVRCILKIPIRFIRAAHYGTRHCIAPRFNMRCWRDTLPSYHSPNCQRLESTRKERPRIRGLYFRLVKKKLTTTLHEGI